MAWLNKRQNRSCRLAWLMTACMHTLPQHSSVFHGCDCLQAAMSAFKLLSPIYTYLFLLVRSVIAPPTVAWFAYALQKATALPTSCR